MRFLLPMWGWKWAGGHSSQFTDKDAGPQRGSCLLTLCRWTKGKLMRYRIPKWQGCGEYWGPKERGGNWLRTKLCSDYSWSGGQVILESQPWGAEWTVQKSNFCGLGFEDEASGMPFGYKKVLLYNWSVVLSRLLCYSNCQAVHWQVLFRQK